MSYPAVAVALFAVVPVGLLALAVTLWRDRTAPRDLRVLPTVAVVVFALAPVLVGALPDSTERPIMLVWLVAIAATWVALARALGRTDPPIAATAR